MNGNVLNNLDWSGWLRTWSEQLMYCTSEEDLYKKLNKFKEELNSDYGKLSRRKRNKNGFTYAEGDE